MLFLSFLLLFFSSTIRANSLETYTKHLQEFESSQRGKGLKISRVKGQWKSKTEDCLIRYIDLSKRNPLAHGYFAGIQMGEESIGIDLESLDDKKDMWINGHQAKVHQAFIGYDQCQYEMTFFTDLLEKRAFILERKKCPNSQKTHRYLQCLNYQ